MKKLFLTLLVIALCISLVACSTPATSTQPQQTTAPTTAPTQPVKIQLTPENVEEFLIISCVVTDVTITDDPYSSAKRGTGTLKISVSPKKRGDFEGVTLELDLKGSSKAWSDTMRIVEIPIDGKTEHVSTDRTPFTSDYISPAPSYTISIKSVTGYFVEK